MSAYTGPVCYADGWHWSVGANGQPDKRLVLERDGIYRYATDGDTESWHDRHHSQYITVELN